MDNSMERLRYIFLDNKTFRRLLQVKGKRITLSVGYGVLAEEQVSVRLMAYLVPAINLAEYLMRHNTVHMRIYFAQSAAGIVLGQNVDAYAVSAWAESARIYLEKFLAHFGNNVSFSIQRDRKWAGDLLRTIERLANIFWPPRILDRVSSYPNPRRSLRYLAAHALYMLDPLDIPCQPILEGESLPPEADLVVMIGGPQERLSAEVRSCLREKFGIHNQWENWSLETHVGKLPPYYSTHTDLSLSDLKSADLRSLWGSRKQFDPDAFSDLEYLAAHCFGGDFENRRTEEVFVLGLEELQKIE